MPDELHSLELQSVGIEKAYRQLLIFIDKDLYEQGILISGKAILINLAAQIGGKDKDFIHRFALNNNSTLIKLSVYYFDVIFDPVSGLDGLKDAEFTLSNAHSSELINDFNINQVLRPDVSIYNKIMSTTLNEGNKTDLFATNFVSSVLIPSPKYYTEQHQKSKENDVYSIIWNDYIMTFEGNDLVDRFTSIDIYDIKTWETMVPALKSKIDNLDVGVKGTSSTSIVSGMFAPTSESIFDSYVFVYDSQLGTDVKAIPGITKVPLSNYRIKEAMVNDLAWIKDQFNMEAKRIEKEHGSLRIYYTPRMCGDKLEIHFKDYVSPVKGFDNVKIDKGYSSTDLLSQMIVEEPGDDGEFL
jgi:hypothetical protein